MIATTTPMTIHVVLEEPLVVSDVVAVLGCTCT